MNERDTVRPPHTEAGSLRHYSHASAGTHAAGIERSDYHPRACIPWDAFICVGAIIGR
ncbi:hypothetical protein [Pseudomonas sp. PS01301]|uniref:hypothetical protein n=1 Tax=Pseudomonas sp. PS01301 TaxID=2991437 RepID=UPI00249BDCA3|nr:hypothetical protein [Pseudomonas sp. PS01301]